MSQLPGQAEAFLRDLEAHLAPFPEGERRDIVAEIRTHLVDRAAQGAGDLLAPFGTPEEYAAAFLDERALARALSGGTTWSLGRAVLGGARRLSWWYAVAALGLVQVAGAGLLALSVLKPFLPDRVGLVIGPRTFTLGLRGGAQPPAAELLGWWAIPAFLVLGVGALWSARWMLRALAGVRLAHLRPGPPPGTRPAAGVRAA